MPQRKPELSHLDVGLTEVSLDERLADIKVGAGPKELARMNMQLRQDLLEATEDSENSRPAKSALKCEKNRLAELGYELNGVSTIWHTYVADLDPICSDYNLENNCGTV